MAKKTIFRSAKTGKIVTKNYAQKNPSTTVKETIKLSSRSTGGTGPRKK